MPRYIEYQEYPVIPTGEYDARITEVEEKLDGQYGDQFQYSFEITSGEQKGHPLLGWSSQKFSKKSKLREWATAVTQRSFGPGDGVNVDEMIDKPIRISVMRKRADDGSEFNKIDSVLPPSIAQKKRAAQSTEATEGSNTVEEPLHEDELLF